jgi:predicted enzyme involved in methoxymalonyl-ACP biosynthesis
LQPESELWKCEPEAGLIFVRLPDVHVFDYAGIVTNVGTARFFDRKLWTLARAAASHDGQMALAHGIARAVRAVTRAALKCIVVDLDNTLWGGVVGDDGIGGIKLGDDGGGEVCR